MIGCRESRCSKSFCRCNRNEISPFSLRTIALALLCKCPISERSLAKGARPASATLGRRQRRHAQEEHFGFGKLAAPCVQTADSRNKRFHNRGVPRSAAATLEMHYRHPRRRHRHCLASACRWDFPNRGAAPSGHVGLRAHIRPIAHTLSPARHESCSDGVCRPVSAPVPGVDARSQSLRQTASFSSRPGPDRPSPVLGRR